MAARFLRAIVRALNLTLITPQFYKISRRKSKVLKDDGEQRSWHNGHAHGQWFSDVISNGGTMKVSSNLLTRY